MSTARWRGRMKAEDRCVNCGRRAYGKHLCSKHMAMRRKYQNSLVVKSRFNIYGTAEWANWVRGFIADQDTTISELFQFALFAMADECGYPEPPSRTGKEVEV